MSINHAILGILSYKPMTGYDLKKIIQDSSFMHWSGNNNQIYKSLSELLEKRFVTHVVEHQQSSPTKKIYTVTSEGLAELKEWVLSPSEPNEVRKPFLVQLAMAKQLNTKELHTLLESYENDMKWQMLMEKSKQEDVFSLSDTSVLQKTLWDFINANIQRSYETELQWLKDLRNAIDTIPNENDAADISGSEAAQRARAEEALGYAVISSESMRYVHFNDSAAKLENEKAIVTCIGILAENNTDLMIFDEGSLSRDFLEPDKRLVGSLLQKFTMYHIKSAIIVKNESALKAAFKKAIIESEKQGVLRLFTSTAEAEEWFLSLK